MLLKIEGSSFFAVWALRIFDSAPLDLGEFFAKRMENSLEIADSSVFKRPLA